METTCKVQILAPPTKLNNTMDFEYLDVEQRSPEWFGVRMGRITASRLKDWMAVSKAKGKEGTPLKAREDYERELWFERKFGVSFNNFVSAAMLDGQMYEDYARLEYSNRKGVTVMPCGIFYNEFFAASPDGLIEGDGLLEIKVLRDNTFTEVLLNGVPDDHWKQVQGQLFASGRDYCDYVALNLSTKKFAIWKVTPNADFFAQLEASLREPLTVEDVATNEIYSIEGELPHADNLFQEYPTGNPWQTT